MEYVMPIVIDFVIVTSFFSLVMSAVAVCHLHNKRRYFIIVKNRSWSVDRMFLVCWGKQCCL